MFPKITLKRANRHPGSGTCWHASMNSLDLLCSTFEQCRINFTKSQTYHTNFGNPSIYEIKCTICTIKFNKNFNLCRLHDFCRQWNKQNFTPLENVQKRSLFFKGKSRNNRLMWRGTERAKATTKHMRQLGKLVIFSNEQMKEKRFNTLIRERDTQSTRIQIFQLVWFILFWETCVINIVNKHNKTAPLPVPNNGYASMSRHDVPILNRLITTRLSCTAVHSAWYHLVPAESNVWCKHWIKECSSMDCNMGNVEPGMWLEHGLEQSFRAECLCILELKDRA